MIWIGLGLLVLGTLIFSLIGLVWTHGTTPLHKLGFPLGALLFALGTLLVITAG